MSIQTDRKSPKAQTARRRILPHIPYLIIILLVTLGLRILPYYKSTSTNDGPIVRDPDGSYHLRRMELIIHNFPTLPVFDSYINHPNGAYIIWPPLYDLLLAAIWSVMDLLPGLSSPLVALVFLPPMLMVLACVVVYRIGLRLLSKRKWLACGAALVPALLPATLFYSYLGQLDHHVAEFLFIVLFIDAFAVALTRLPESTKFRQILHFGWLPGLYLGLGLLVQHGLLLLEAVIFLPLIILYRNKGAQIWAMGGAINAIAFLVTLPLGLYCHLNGVPLAHTHFGGFQPLVLAEATLFYTTLWLITSPSVISSRKVRTLAIGASTVLTLAIGAFILRETLAGASYVIRTWSGWQAHIGESQSLLKLPLSEALPQLGMRMSWLVLFLPVGWILLFRRWRQLSALRWVLLFSTLIFAIMGVLQMRYLPYLALFLGLMVAFMVEHFMKSWRRTVIIAVVPLFIVISYYPCIKTIGAKDISFNVFEQLYPVLQWLRGNSPPTSNYLNPTAPAEYGVLAEWSLGHYIQYYGHRPALADNFGEHANDLQRLSQFFLAQDNQTAYQILDKHRVRYILCRDLFWTLQSLLIDEHSNDYIVGGSFIGDSASQVTFSPKLFPTVLYRLIWRYGSSVVDRKGTYFPPLERLRLVAESVGSDDQIMGGPDIALIKLFEYVPGARIEIVGLPSNSEVTLSGIVHTPHKRWFPYIQILHSDSNGNISLVLPYSNDSSEGNSYVDQYSLQCGNDTRFFSNISNTTILEGETIHLRW